MVITAAPSSASAQSAASVRVAQLAFDAGADHFQAGRYDDAIRRFREALAIMDSADILWNIARAYEEKGEAANAVHHFQQFADSYPKDPSAAEARRRVAKLSVGLPGWLLIDCGFGAATVTVNKEITGSCGDRLGPLTPGAHLVQVIAPARAPWSAEVTVEALKTQTVVANLIVVSQPEEWSGPPADLANLPRDDASTAAAVPPSTGPMMPAPAMGVLVVPSVGTAGPSSSSPPSFGVRGGPSGGSATAGGASQDPRKGGKVSSGPDPADGTQQAHREPSDDSASPMTRADAPSAPSGPRWAPWFSLGAGVAFVAVAAVARTRWTDADSRTTVHRDATEESYGTWVAGGRGDQAVEQQADEDYLAFQAADDDLYKWSATSIASAGIGVALSAYGIYGLLAGGGPAGAAAQIHPVEGGFVGVLTIPAQ